MGLALQIARQLARPSGCAGRLLGSVMDATNRKPTRRALDLLDLRPGEMLLDAGCGTGAALSEALVRAPCHLAGVDASDAMIHAARRKLGARASLQVGTVEDLHFPEGTFDAALALNVLYFCDAQSRMLASLRRVLKPGGRLVAYVTHRESMQNWPFARQGLHRLFDEQALREAIIAGGFAPGRIRVHAEPITRSVRGIFACAER